MVIKLKWGNGENNLIAKTSKPRVVVEMDVDGGFGGFRWNWWKTFFSNQVEQNL